MHVVTNMVKIDTDLLSEVENKIGYSIKNWDEKSIPEDTEILICRDRDLTSEMILSCPNLKFIYVVSAGVEKLPYDIICEKNIIVANASGICDESISDYVIGSMIAFSSKLYDCILYKQQKYWKPYLFTDTLRGKNLTVVGTGRIGCAIAAKAKVFGLNVTGVRKNKISVKNFDRIVTNEEMDSILPDSDYIVCTVPLTPSTNNMFGYDRFCIMKESAIFINVSRGKVINEQDFIRAVREGKIFGGALDVFNEEPLSVDSELWDLENVILSPHSSGRVKNFMKCAMDIFVSNFEDYINGRELSNVVDTKAGY